MIDQKYLITKLFCIPTVLFFLLIGLELEIQTSLPTEMVDNTKLSEYFLHFSIFSVLTFVLYKFENYHHKKEENGEH